MLNYFAILKDSSLVTYLGIGAKANSGQYESVKKNVLKHRT